MGNNSFRYSQGGIQELSVSVRCFHFSGGWSALGHVKTLGRFSESWPTHQDLKSIGMLLYILECVTETSKSFGGRPLFPGESGVGQVVEIIKNLVKKLKDV
ncbi:unnamed protein product [Lactuca virosa]|uniref:Uncharacterized protein n=1 Tax=Lactuca virosa TaxID=75947 RepID=A0AAU9LWL2_9ASTR|nr:unnamed protein product [Lactuca virosa]